MVIRHEDIDPDEMRLEYHNMKSQLTALDLATVNTSERATKLDEKITARITKLDE